MAKSITELHDSGKNKGQTGLLGTLSFPTITVFAVGAVSLITGIYSIFRYLDNQNWIWVVWAALNLGIGAGLIARQRWSRRPAILLYTLDCAVMLFLLKSSPGWYFLMITFWMACLLALLDSNDAFPVKAIK